MARVKVRVSARVRIIARVGVKVSARVRIGARVKVQVRPRRKRMRNVLNSALLMYFRSKRPDIIVCICEYLCMHVCVYVCMYVCMYVFMYVAVCAGVDCVCVYTHACD